MERTATISNISIGEKKAEKRRYRRTSNKYNVHLAGSLTSLSGDTGKEGKRVHSRR